MRSTTTIGLIVPLCHPHDNSPFLCRVSSSGPTFIGASPADLRNTHPYYFDTLSLFIIFDRGGRTIMHAILDSHVRERDRDTSGPPP